MESSRSYSAAIALLRSRSRQRSTTFIKTDSSPSKFPLPSGNYLGNGKPPVLHMKEWLRKLGYTDKNINGLNIIHVAGTKGKGSTCAYIESFLRVRGKTNGPGQFFPRKTGLYTSPDLESVTERIRINFEPLSEYTFAKYFFEVYDTLQLDDPREGPGFLQLLALVSFHTFLQEGVDVAIYETHHGGEFCATNVISEPVVVAITTIGIDHVVDLGRDIEDIAWHKAGIFKPGASAFTVPQKDEALRIIQRRATEKEVSFRIVETDPSLLLPGRFSSRVLQLNCSLARTVVDEFLRKRSPAREVPYLSPDEIDEGIRQYYWPGRFEIIPRADENCTWFVDVAHNELSITEAAGWFGRESASKHTCIDRILIYGHKPTDKRDADEVLRTLARSLEIPLQSVIFTPDIKPADRESKRPLLESDFQFLERYSRIWKDIRPDDIIFQASSTSQAVNIAREKGGCDKHILVTGSHHIVGEVMSIVKPQVGKTTR